MYIWRENEVSQTVIDQALAGLSGGSLLGFLTAIAALACWRLSWRARPQPGALHGLAAGVCAALLVHALCALPFGPLAPLAFMLGLYGFGAWTLSIAAVAGCAFGAMKARGL